MENKFNMTKEDNIFFAKRKLIDNIHDGKKIKDADVKGLTGEPEDTTKKTETTEDDD